MAHAINTKDVFITDLGTEIVFIVEHDNHDRVRWVFNGDIEESGDGADAVTSDGLISYIPDKGIAWQNDEPLAKVDRVIEHGESNWFCVDVYRLGNVMELIFTACNGEVKWVLNVGRYEVGRGKGCSLSLKTDTTPSDITYDPEHRLAFEDGESMVCLRRDSVGL
tara:strand:- start:912 stop:1406 length:495 start_codon:yes stop_codon:yes gene_type:complete